MIEKLQQDSEVVFHFQHPPYRCTVTSETGSQALKSEIELESRYAQRRTVPDDVVSALTEESE